MVVALFKTFLDAVMSKDVDAALAMFADDAILIDPHYPQPRMRGRDEIERGLRWALDALEKPGFKVRNSAVNGDRVFRGRHESPAQDRPESRFRSSVRRRGSRRQDCAFAGL